MSLSLPYLPESELLPQVYNHVTVNEYVRRKANLSLLGYASYRQYLRSPLWKSIRAVKLKRDPRCYGCGKAARQVHHSTYAIEVLRGGDSRGLWSVCRRCHRWIEFCRNGNKRSPSQATDELKRIHKMRIGMEDRRVDYRVIMTARSRARVTKYKTAVCKF